MLLERIEKHVMLHFGFIHKIQMDYVLDLSRAQLGLHVYILGGSVCRTWVQIPQHYISMYLESDLMFVS